MKIILHYILFFIIMLFLSCEKKNIHKNNHSESILNVDTIKYTDQNYKEAYPLINLAKREKDFQKLGSLYLALGNYYSDQSINDSAYSYFNRAKEEFLVLNDSAHIGISYVNMMVPQFRIGDYYGVEESAVQALQYLDKFKNNQLYFSAMYNLLASSKLQQKDYEKALKYYSEALKYSEGNVNYYRVKNNQAVVYLRLKKQDSAIDILEDLLKKKQLKKYPIIDAKAQDNLAYAYWLKDSSYNPIPTYLEAIKTLKEQKFYVGLVYTYAHLSEYYEKKNTQQAIFYVKKYYDLATYNIKNADVRLEALERLIILESPTKAKEYLPKYMQIKDSLFSEREKAKNQFSLLRYEAKKDKEENIQLKLSSALKSNEILEQRMFIFIIPLITITLILSFFLWVKLRKKS